MARAHVGDASWMRVSSLSSIHICLALILEVEVAKELEIQVRG